MLKPYRTNRNRAYYRHHRNRVINRKRNIAKQIHWHVQNLQYGRLNKEKIHCSCWMCSEKTQMLGFPKSEKARIEGYQQQFTEYIEEN